MRVRPDLRPVAEVGPCPICGVTACNHVDGDIFARPDPPSRPYTVTEIVMNPAYPWVVLYGGGDVIELEEAVRLGLTEWVEPDPPPPPRGARAGQPATRTHEEGP